MRFIKVLFILFFAVALQSCLSADEDPVYIPPIKGAVLQPNISGEKEGFKPGSEPNQVWVKLSDSAMTANKRTDWDLGFYSGDEFRVVINGSIIMAAGKIPNATNIDAVSPSQVASLQNEIMVGSFVASNLQYVDNPNGLFLNQTTGIAPISSNDSDSPIYLVNMGRDIYNETIAPGSAITGGDSRGWMLIQIIRSNNGYKLKYKDLNSTDSHLEYTIVKNPDYALNFFSLKQGKEVTIQPKRKNWDIGFTVFTNEVFYTPGGLSAGSYVYADFVINNITDGVGSYEVVVPTGNNADQYYDSFKTSDIDASKFIFNDQRAIGDHWRTVTGNNGAQVYGDRFYVIKSSDGFFFKLRFNKMLNSKGERGYPEFEYEPL